MNIQVIGEKENPLLKRREVLASIDYQGSSTPSKADLQKTLADHFKVNVDNVEISKIMSEVGMPKGKAWIKIWQEKKVPIYAELKKEKKKKEKKEKPKEEKKEVSKPETEPKTEVKEEKKPEEPKEEVKKAKAEEKPEASKEEQKVEEKKE